MRGTVRSPVIRRFVGGLLVVMAIGGVLLALHRASEDARSVVWPKPGAVAVCAMCLVVTLLTGSWAWAVLFEGPQRNASVARGFLVAQLGKYVPGGAVQIAGQIGMARRAGVDAVDAAVALPIHAATTVGSAGGAASIVFAFVAESSPILLRFAMVVAGATAISVVVVPRLFEIALDAAGRRWSSVPTSSALPDRGSIRRSALFGAVGAVAYGAAFVALLGPTTDGVAVGAGFFVSFTVGFSLLPVPAGIGIRELVVVLLLESYQPVAALVAAGVVLRIVQLVVELVVAGVLGALVRPGPAATSPD